MKKVCLILFALFAPAVVCGAVKYYSDTEQKYYFEPDVLSSQLELFVPKEETRVACAELYTSLMNQENGQVSVTDLFAVCRKAGFNTYRKDGFDKCREFVSGLLAADELGEFMTGYCPGLDENGKNPNALKSITDQTQIGDFCSSTNIAGGEVVFRKGYNCTCAAYACNPGFQSEKGACVTEYKDANGDCLRKEYTNITNIKAGEGALQFCESNAIKGCKVRNAIRNFGGVKGRLVCNATRDEVDNAKARMLDNQDKQIAGLQYYDVCRQYKGKTGKKEYCIDKLFSGLDVGLNEAAGLAQLYATEKYGHTVYCDPSHNKRTIDDYFNCATLDKSIYYTFKFDDTVETNDAKKFRNTVRGIALIYGLPEKANNTISGACTTKLQNAAKRFGMKAQTSNNSCVFDYGIKTDSKNVDSTLHTIEGIDNYVFYYEIQLRGSTRLRDNLKQYIKDQGFVITAFDCDNSYGRIKKRFIEGDDETLTCKLSGTRNGTRYTNQPVDFVFDDLSESRKTTREAGDAGMTCIISGGAYANKKCHGLDQNQCTQVNAKLKAENPKSSGTKWQNGQCVLIDVQEQNRLENGIQIGLSVIALADCATVIIGNAQGVMGCTLAVVEITGWVTEMTTGAAMQQRADDFIKIAVACNNRTCAKNTLKTMAAKALTIQDALKSASTANQIDVQLARLVGYLEPEDLQSEVSANDWDDIVRQLGGDPNDTAGRALKVANKIGFIAQFASLGASALRLTGRAIAKVASKSAAKTAVSGTKALAVVGMHADDTASAFAKTAAHADEAARAADNAADAARGATNGARAAGQADDAARGATNGARAAGRADDAARGATGGARAAGQADDAARGATNGAKAAGQADDAARGATNGAKAAGQADDAARGATNGAKAAGQADDAARGATGGARAAGQADDAARGAANGARTAEKSQEIVYDMAYFSKNASGTDDVFKGADDLVQINRQNMPANVIRDLMKKAKQYGFACTDCGGDILKFSKSVDEAADAARAADNVSDAARGARAAGQADDAARGATNGAKAAGQAEDVAGAADRASDAARGASAGAIPNDFSPAAREYINEINDIGKNRDYVIIRGTGTRNTNSPLSVVENDYVNQLLKDRDDLISINFTQPDGGGGILGANKIIVKKTSDMFPVETENGIKWFRRIKTKSIDNLQGKAITTINGKKVFLEPLDNGDLIGNVSGRPVVVVNYDGYKIPFYTSSGSAGKLEVPTGKWEVFFGFGRNDDWFNKADINSIVGHYGSPELKQIAQALDDIVGDQRNVEDVFSTVSRKAYNGIGNVASYDGASVSTSFINRMLDFTPVDYPRGGSERLLRNIEHVKGYFK